MIKVIAHIHRNPALTPEQFRAYWTDVHVPLIKSTLPSLRHYHGCFPMDVPGRTLTNADAIVELGFDDFATMEREMNAPEFLTPERQSSSARLLDLPRMTSVVVEVMDVM